VGFTTNHKFTLTNAQVIDEDQFWTGYVTRKRAFSVIRGLEQRKPSSAPASSPSRYVVLTIF